VHQQRALAATATAHDDEYIAAIDGEIKITLYDELTVSQGHIFDRKTRSGHNYIPRL
jgi:hypothetical protein